MTNNFATFLKSRGWTPQNGLYLSPYTKKLHEESQALLVEGVFGPAAHRIAQEAMWPLKITDEVLEQLEHRP